MDRECEGCGHGRRWCWLEHSDTIQYREMGRASHKGIAGFWVHGLHHSSPMVECARYGRGRESSGHQNDKGRDVSEERGFYLTSTGAGVGARARAGAGQPLWVGRKQGPRLGLL